MQVDDAKNDVMFWALSRVCTMDPLLFLEKIKPASKTMLLFSMQFRPSVFFGDILYF